MVISQVHLRHRAIEFRKFLVRIGKAVPADLDVPLVCENSASISAGIGVRSTYAAAVLGPLS